VLLAIVPESQHAPALAFEVCGAPRIRLVIEMLTSIGFDDHVMPGASKVDYEGADRVLAAKRVSEKAAVTKEEP